SFPRSSRSRSKAAFRPTSSGSPTRAPTRKLTPRGTLKLFGGVATAVDRNDADSGSSGGRRRRARQRAVAAKGLTLQAPEQEAQAPAEPLEPPSVVPVVVNGKPERRRVTRRKKEVAIAPPAVA